MGSGGFFIEAAALARISAPSNSRILAVTWDAMYSHDVIAHRQNPRSEPSSAESRYESPAPEAAHPHSGLNRTVNAYAQQNRSSCFGGKSEVITICFWWLHRALNVWKNSSIVASLPAKNWISSISRTSTLVVNLFERRTSSSRIELMRSFVNSSDHVAHPQIRVQMLGVVADRVQQVGFTQDPNRRR